MYLIITLIFLKNCLNRNFIVLVDSLEVDYIPDFPRRKAESNMENNMDDNDNKTILPWLLHVSLTLMRYTKSRQ